MAQNVAAPRPATRAEPTSRAVSPTAIPAERTHVRRVILASSLGALFEAYDLVLFGPMAAVIARQFFSALDEAYA